MSSYVGGSVQGLQKDKLEEGFPSIYPWPKPLSANAENESCTEWEAPTVPLHPILMNVMLRGKLITPEGNVHQPAPPGSSINTSLYGYRDAWKSKGDTVDE